MTKPAAAALKPQATLRQTQSPLFYATLAGGAFICTLALLGVLLFKAEILTQLGLVGKLYYLVLALLGLTAAAFLFGAMKSYASYEGKVLGGTLELGGPALIFALVIIGGFYLPQPETAFSITVNVAGESGALAAPLRNAKVVIDLGQDRRAESINDKGQAVFLGIPGTLRNQEVAMSFHADGYEMVDAKAPHKLVAGQSLTIVVRPITRHLRGSVHNKSGTLAGARVRFGDANTTTDSAGYFTLTVRQSSPATGELNISADGYLPYHMLATLDSTDLPPIELARATP